jgi:2-polyprenyl-6-hydroxyphenyl methylase/3-demethylubiquinone-9 3-methyltransferase
VRRLFGPWEPQVAGAYRAAFIDLADWLRVIGQWAPDARNILEVGCGEGAVTERLRDLYPRAQITAIDVTPRLGRLFRGERERVRFRQAPVQEIAAGQPGAFDLVILSDVLHHVPLELRDSILAAIGQALAPGGIFAFKDWARDQSPIHWACEASDRVLTGDDVSYLTAADMRALLTTHFGPGALRQERRVRPWGNNLAILVSRAGAASGAPPPS